MSRSGTVECADEDVVSDEDEADENTASSKEKDRGQRGIG